VDYEQRSPVDPRRAGGDVVCMSDAGDGSALISVVDLAVKAEAAARQAEVIRGAFAIAAARGFGPRRTMELFNAALGAYGQAHDMWPTFGTALVLTCSVGGVVAYASAGAEPAILFRRDGRHEHFGATGPLVGLERDWFGAEAAAVLAPGDRIVAYTDGVTESRSTGTSRAFLGTSGLVSIVRRSLVDTRSPSSHAIMEAIETLWNRGRHLDDTTLLVVSRTSLTPKRTIAPRVR
jgi:sigma-B regulation protein RsbU (phosphoserine phosphatase)